MLRWLGMLGVVIPFLAAIAAGVVFVAFCALQCRWDNYEGREKTAEKDGE